MTESAKQRETISPLAGKPAPKSMLISAIPPNWWPSVPAAIAALRSMAVSLNRTFWPSRRPFANIAGSRVSMVLYIWERTLMLFLARRKALLCKCSLPTRSKP
jgi:hypothetical protein